MTVHTLEAPPLEIKKWIEDWGSSSSEMLIDLSCEIFTEEGTSGMVGYRLVADYAVSFGDPVCPKEDWERLITAFHQFCNYKQLRVIYLCTSQEFAVWAKQRFCKIAIEVGSEYSFNPCSLTCLEGHKGYRLRNRIRHAEKRGVKCVEYFGGDSEREASMNEVAKEWLKARQGPQIHLGPLQFFEERKGRRWFYLEWEGKTIGVAMLCALNKHEGWLLKFLMVTPTAPRGASEALLISIFNILAKENCRYVTYGTVAAETIDFVEGLGPVAIFALKKIYALISKTFQLEKKRMYWQKFRPHSESLYLLFSHSNIGWKEVRALMKSIKIDWFPRL